MLVSDSLVTFYGNEFSSKLLIDKKLAGAAGVVHFYSHFIQTQAAKSELTAASEHKDLTLSYIIAHFVFCYHNDIFKEYLNHHS